MKTAPWPAWVRGLLLAAIPIIALSMCGLGLWQLARLQERRASNAAIAARIAQPPLNLNDLSFTGRLDDWEYRSAIARGAFDFDQEIVWRNQPHGESPGVHLITPLRLAGRAEAVLVDRGWIPYTQAELAARRPYQTPAGVVALTGLLRKTSLRTASFLPADPPLSPDLPRLDSWFWIDIAQIQHQVPYPLLPLLLVQAPEANSPPLPIRDDTLDLSDGPHLSYAIQWFAFAFIAVVGPLIYWQRSRRPRVS